MKPFTPRIRTRFIKAGCASFSFFDFDEAQDFTIAAEREPFARLLKGTRPAVGRRAIGHLRAMNQQAVAEGAGIRRGHRAHEVVDLARALAPIDAPVFRSPAAVVATLVDVIGPQGRLPRAQRPDAPA